MKKTILIHLEGVICQNEENYDKNVIPSLREEAYNFVRELSKYHKIIIFTNRNVFLVSKWLKDNGFDKYITQVTNVKIYSWLVIDYECVKLKENYQKILKVIKNYTPCLKDTKD